MNQLQKANNPLAKITEALNFYKTKIAQALPKGRNVDQEISSVLAMVSSDAKLQKSSPESIAQACFDAATLGLPINRLGLAYLVSYGEQVKLLISYKGYIHLVLQSGIVLDIFAECVYSKDKFRYLAGTSQTIFHEPVVIGNRGDFVAVYAIARLSNGLTKPCIIRKSEVDIIRSKSRSPNNGPWVSDYDEMAKKSSIKRLCKLLPYSCLPEMLHTIEEIHEPIDVEAKPLELDTNEESIVNSPTQFEKANVIELTKTIVNEENSRKQKLIFTIDKLLNREAEITGKKNTHSTNFANWTEDQLSNFLFKLGQRLESLEEQLIKTS